MCAFNADGVFAGCLEWSFYQPSHSGIIPPSRSRFFAKGRKKCVGEFVHVRRACHLPALPNSFPPLSSLDDDRKPN